MNRTHSPLAAAMILQALQSSPDRIEWEGRVFSAICELADCGNGDAQGLCETPEAMATLTACWMARRTPEETARVILDEGADLAGEIAL